jgi:hypothetical protein
MSAGQGVRLATPFHLLEQWHQLVGVVERERRVAAANVLALDKHVGHGALLGQVQQDRLDVGAVRW